MWAFISARLRRWILFAIIVPAGTTLIHVVRTRLEERSGPTKVTKVLSGIENFGYRRKAGRRAR
jgi:hypothetical protein